MKLRIKWDSYIVLGAIMALFCISVTLAFALHQSHANERSLSAKVDALMKDMRADRTTYTVTVREAWDKDLLEHYLEHGRTNEFHAWAVPISIETNKPVGKASKP